jgi:hypothetical protein
MKDSVKIEFEAKPARRLFHRCQVCGSEWPISAEYCWRCAIWLGSACNTEDIRWFVPTNKFPAGVKRNLSDGIYEATVLTVAACDSFYSSRSKCPELLKEGAEQIVALGGVITRGPGGHLTGCFASRNLIESAIRAVQCARAVQIESEEYGLKTFLGINTGPIVVRSPMDQESGESRREVSGRVINGSEALAFSLYPRMIVLSSATFKLVAPRFECYGTGPVHLWGAEQNAPKTVYVVAGTKRVINWKDRLEDGSIPLVGREEELRLLCQCWEKTRSGKMPVGLTIHLVGEPGTGKSKLLQAFLSKVSEPGNDLILIKLAGANYGGRSGLLLEEFLSECFRQGILGGKATGERPGMGSENLLIPRFFLARVKLICQLISELKKLGPSLIVIDDIHWADKESIKVFGKAFSNLPAGMMVIASCRPSGSGLAKLLTGSPTAQITLGPMSEGEAKEVSKLHSREREWISKSAWRELWKKSQGNPLYVEEATKLLLTRRESSVGETRTDINPAGLSLPGTRAGLLLTRIQEWAARELDELREELSLRWGCSLPNRLASLETQVNDWLDRLETQGYAERNGLAECLDELERFQSRVVEVCLMGGVSRPLTTRLGEALSRLYGGSYKDHYRYLLRISKEGESCSWVGHQALRVGQRAFQAGRLREAVRFFSIAEQMLPEGHPLRGGLLEDAGDANLMLGRSGEAAGLYERALIENRIANPHDEVAHKLLAARILTGEQWDLQSCECRDDPCPWHYILMSANAFLSKKNETALLLAQKARELSSDWVTRSTACLVEALSGLLVGKVGNAAMLCQQAAETMESGGPCLLSLGLHWILSQVGRSSLRKNHIRACKSTARQLGITDGLRAFQDRFDFFQLMREATWNQLIIQRDSSLRATLTILPVERFKFRNA